MNSRRQWLFAVAALAAGAGGMFVARSTRSSDPVTMDFPGAAYPLPDLSGTPHTLATWTGKLLVVNFWATWCPPCLKEIPDFVLLQRDLSPKGLQFVGIALDDVDAVQDFAARLNVNYPLLVGEEPVMALMREFGNTHGGLPFTVVLGPTGKILHTRQGEWPRAEAEAVLGPLLAALPEAPDLVAK